MLAPMNGTLPDRDTPEGPRTDAVGGGLKPRTMAIIALAAGAVAGIGAAAAAPDSPWWLPVFLAVVAATVAWRLLRFRPRRPGWEDEV
jgi:hypothetical protein